MMDRIGFTMRQGRTLATIVAATALLVTLQGQAAATEISMAAKELIPAAKKEGTLNLAWGVSTLGGSKGVKRFQAGFNKFYGLDHKLKFTVGIHFAGQTRKLIEELKAGQKAFMDVALIAGPQVGPWIKANGLIPVNWKAMMPGISPAILNKVVSDDNTYVTIVSHNYVIAYNKNLIKPAEAPRSMKDLLLPKWKGKIASTPYGAGFTAAWPKQQLLNYANKLSANLAGLMRCGEYDRITSGEFPIFALACESGRIRQDIARGSPMGLVIPTDFPLLVHWYFGVPKHSRNPATAKLFIAWILSPDGQKVLYRNQGSDLSLLPGSRTAKLLDDVRKQAGRDFVTVDATNAKTTDWGTTRAVAKIFREWREK